MKLRWFERPGGDAVVLRQTPRLASWNRATDPDQVRLREYLDDTKQLLEHRRVEGPWALALDVGLPAARDLTNMADLDNYAFPLAVHMGSAELVSVWCTKRHAESSTVRISQARETEPPEGVVTVRTTASSQTKAYKEQVRAAVAHTPEIPGAAVSVQIAFIVGPGRNWLNLWKATIDGLDPLLGRTREARDWHPKDGRITELGLHVTQDAALGNDVIIGVAGSPAES